MDQKEIKVALKNAREAIRNKDWREALKFCKSVLKQDKTNYNALVFVGVAAEGMEEPDKAVSAYKRAIDAAPEQLLAWQGLCGFYEKHDQPEYKQGLSEVYEKLMELNASDEAKSFEYGTKLCQLYRALGNNEKAIDGYHKLTQKHKSLPQIKDTWINLADLLEQLKTPPAEFVKLLDEVYKALIYSYATDQDSETVEKYWIKYIKHLQKNQTSSEKVMSECQVMVDKYPSSAYPLETQCMIILTDYIQDIQCSAEQLSMLKKLSSSLKTITSESPVLAMTQGYIKMMEKNWISARNLFAEGLKLQSNPPVKLQLYLAYCQLQLHDARGVMETAKDGLKRTHKKDTCQQKPLCRSLHLIQAKAMLDLGGQDNIAQTIKMLTKGYGPSCESDSWMQYTDMALTYCYALIDDGQLELAQKVFDGQNFDSNLGSTKALKGWLLFAHGNHTEAIKCLEEASKVDPADAAIMYCLAKVQWEENKDRKTAFENFLKAAKLDPYRSDTFLHLGHFYADNSDQQKARRCYQKAFDLNHHSDSAGQYLVDTLVALGDQDSSLRVLTEVTSQASAGGAKWAWLRLGLHQLHHDDPSTAVKSFQCALRADPKDNHCWECVGEAYIARGSYNSALKAFTRASELDPDSLYCMYQIASIKQLVGLYSEAAAEYELILQRSPEYVPALKGVGESYLLLSRASLSEVFDGRAVTQCEKAITYLSKAALHRPDMMCLWKLLGDSCTVVHSLAEDGVRVKVSPKLYKVDGSEDTCEVGKKELLALGGRCYWHALKLSPTSSSLWHDLGVNYFRQALTCSETAEARQLGEKAVGVLKKATSLAPTVHAHWTALGVVAASRVVNHLPLAQHCFIKSIQVESNNVSAWVNLGVLYLTNNEAMLAHEAFKTAQSLDPKYVAAWIGQALVAETIGDQEAMDLFRHTTEMSHHIEGSSGYGHWVCMTLGDLSNRDTELYKYSIEQMAAIPAACDAVAKYTERVKTNPAAYNMHGLLLERQGMKKMAVEAFSRAVELLETSSSVTGPSVSLNDVRSNYARVLCSIGQYEASVAQYQAIQPLTQFTDICGLALALYKAGQLTESYQAYEQALQLCPSQEDQSHVYTAMGMVAYRLCDVEAAKTAFFQSSQCSPPSHQGLLGLCSLGILQSDINLVNAVIQELEKQPNTDKQLAQYYWLKSLVAFKQGSAKEGRDCILKAVHAHPTNAHLWLILSTYLLQAMPDQCAGASVASMEAWRCQFDVSKTLSTVRSLSAMAEGTNSKDALRLVQKAIHMFPDQISCWVSLLPALHCEVVRQRNELLATLIKLSEFVLKQVDELMYLGNSELGLDLKEIYLWCIQHLAVTLATAGRREEAVKWLEKVKNINWIPLSVSAFTSFVNGDQNIDITQTFSTWFNYQLLLETLGYQNRQSDIEAVYANAENNLQGAQKTLAMMHSVQKMFEKAMEDESQTETVLQKLEHLLLINPDCVSLLLMQGWLHLKANKPRNARNCFNQALSNSNASDLEKKVARRLVLPIYQAKKDGESIKALVSSALLCGDADFESLAREVDTDWFSG